MNTLVNQESDQVNKSYGVLHRMKLWTTAVLLSLRVHQRS